MRLKRETLMLLLVLGSFHLGLLQDPATPLSKAILLVHLGLVLLWQRLVSPNYQVSGRTLAGIVALIGLIGVFISWGMVLVWSLMLAGAIGGRLFVHSQPRARVPYWLALVAVVVGQVGLVVPELLKLQGQTSGALTMIAAWGVWPLFLLIMVMPLQEDETAQSGEMDLVGSLLIVLVFTGIILGALALMFLYKLDYLSALFSALGLMAACLLILAWLWAPHGGSAGLGLEVTRRMLSGGGDMPLDRWLDQLADLAMQDISPENFLRSMSQGLLHWHGVCGMRYAYGAGAWVVCGEESAQGYRFEHRGLVIQTFTRQPLANTVLWQLNLRLRMMVEIHAAKLQARQLQADSYLRAVHETGARVTHEIKNLLQSLHGLCFAVISAKDSKDDRAYQLLLKQLPVIVERLEQATARIRKPSAQSMRMEAVARWWPRQQERYADKMIVWCGNATGDLDGEIPAALFDNVLDNLLENALCKAGVLVTVTLSGNVAGWELEVSDDGAAIAVTQAESLFLAPMPSDSGMGIGLYQAGRLAESAGYHLRLLRNRDGEVCFSLKMAGKEPPPAMSDQNTSCSPR
ncbi:sensor histidine kinase [Uliginosibacterium gangwonense]|uniref:sensor histidine kinase n=1 Tax=Uliginosibacterium gangwonense TaxID=392736 RepID=UPI0003650458|nr:ATP-binding protein [Uliginosibacterium gangwonense]